MTTRKNSDRPCAPCTECRYHRDGDRFCPVAGRVPSVRRPISCADFKPLRRAERLARERAATDHSAAPAPAPLLLIGDPDEALKRIEACGLSWAVVEVCQIGGRLAIRYARDAGPDDMNAVVRSLAGPSPAPPNAGTKVAFFG